MVSSSRSKKCLGLGEKKEFDSLGIRKTSSFDFKSDVLFIPDSEFLSQKHYEARSVQSARWWLAKFARTVLTPQI